MDIRTRTAAAVLFAAALALAGAAGDARAQEAAGPEPVAGSGSAQDTVRGDVAPERADDLERVTTEVASELRCPVCQGVSVEDSPTELARQMRAVVREQLAAGRSPEQVRAYFVDKYGEWILLEPKASGFNLLVYVLPWLAMLIGILVIVIAVRRWTRPVAEEAAEETPEPAASAAEP
jgi:cytochrome c-type biogenesis protein CcmH